MTSPSLKVLVLVVASCALLLVAACSDDDTPTTPSPQPGDCVSLLESARLSLESTLYTQLNSDPQGPSDIDFNGPFALYQDAYQCNPNNLDARLGLAVTGLLALAANSEVNAAFEEWREYLESNTPFEVPASPGRPLGIPLALSGEREALFLPFDIIATTLIAKQKLTFQNTDPQISRVQDIFRNIVVPRLQQAANLMRPVADSESYVFLVSPMMQGDLDARTKILDRTDVLAMRASCTLLEAICRLACAYELSFTAYDQVGLLEALDRDHGTFLRLRSDGAQHMNAVPGLVLTAIDLVEEAIDSLLSETGNQDNHIIKIDPHHLSEADLENLKSDILPEVRLAFTTGYIWTADWDNDSSTPDVALEFNLGNFFSNPISDWKLLMPSYSVSTQMEPREAFDTYRQDNMVATVDFPSAGWREAVVYLYAYDYQPNPPYTWGDATLTAVLLPAVEAISAEIMSLPDWGGYFWIDAYVSREFATGPQTFNYWVYSTYSVADTYVYVPVVTWTATNFTDWRDGWTNPSFNGLLPGISSATQLFELFGFGADDWEQEIVLDWTGFGHW